MTSVVRIIREGRGKKLKLLSPHATSESSEEAGTLCSSSRPSFASGTLPGKKTRRAKRRRGVSVRSVTYDRADIQWISALGGGKSRRLQEVCSRTVSSASYVERGEQLVVHKSDVLI